MRDTHLIWPSDSLKDYTTQHKLLPFWRWVNLTHHDMFIHCPFEFPSVNDRKTQDPISQPDWDVLKAHCDMFHNPLPRFDVPSFLIHVDRGANVTKHSDAIARQLIMLAPNANGIPGALHSPWQKEKVSWANHPFFLFFFFSAPLWRCLFWGMTLHYHAREEWQQGKHNLLGQSSHDDGRAAATTQVLSSSSPGIAASAGWQSGRHEECSSIRYHCGRSRHCHPRHGQQRHRDKHHGRSCLVAEAVMTSSTTTLMTMTTMIHVDDARLLVLLRRQCLSTVIISGIGSPWVIIMASLPSGFGGVTKRGGRLQCWPQRDGRRTLTTSPALDVQRYTVGNQATTAKSA